MPRQIKSKYRRVKALKVVTVGRSEVASERIVIRATPTLVNAVTAQATRENKSKSFLLTEIIAKALGVPND